MKFGKVVDPSDGTAAITDLDQIDHWHHDRIACGFAVAFNPVVRGDPHLAIFDQRTLGCGAADIKCYDIWLSDQATEFRRTPKARSRPRFHHGNRYALGGIQRIDTAVGLHHIGSGAKSLGFQTIC